MKPVFLFRLVLDGIAAGLLLLAFAYFWLGNAAHEWAGAGVFLLLVVHNLFHRRWYAGAARKPQVRRGTFNTALTWLLLAGMLALLATSLVISETLLGSLRLGDDFTVRQIHAGIAYWLLLIVSIHLGLRWLLLMAVARKLFGLAQPSAIRTTLLRLVALCIALQGMGSGAALNLHSRLFFQMSLDWWNFEESVAGFFGHCLAVAGLCIFLTYYPTQWLQRRKRSAVANNLHVRPHDA